MRDFWVRRIVVGLLPLLFFSNVLCGQMFIPQSHRVTIKPGLIFASYKLVDDTPAIETLRAQGLRNRKMRAILNNSNENTWPRGLESLSARRNNFFEIQKYKANIIGGFSDKYVLCIPAYRNQHMPKSLRPSRDFYLIIRSDGVLPERTKE